jgi:branched-chain amino acid aminotransferase
MSAGFTDQFFLQNNELFKCESPLEKEEVKISVYEVMKVIQGIPLFIEDHLFRLNESMELSNITYPISITSNIHDQITRLCSANNKNTGNIELRISKYLSGNSTMYLGFIAHSYPIENDYQQGIQVGLFLAERTIPNAKVKNTDTRLKANTYIAKAQVTETLLYNQKGYITEGSRSNVFFIKGDRVFTAPADMVLKGISRKYVIKVLDKLKILWTEGAIHLDDLHSMDAGFICGTSPGVLPLNSIEEIKLNAQNAILVQIMEAFNNQVSEYIKTVKFQD